MPTSVASPPQPSSPAAAVSPPQQDEDLWRVYHPQWTIAWTVTGTRQDSLASLRERCWDHFEATFEGRVRVNDVRVDEFPEVSDEPMARLMLRLPVMKGEFKYRAGAIEFVDREQRVLRGAQIVQRNSKDDHALRNYSVVKLPDE